MKEKKLSSLNDLMGYDVIINCSGLGAGKPVNDENIRPARDQVVLVSAPWIKHFVINNKRDKLTYVRFLVQIAWCLEAQLKLETGTSVNPDTIELIMSRCVSLIPSLCGAEAGLEGDRCEILWGLKRRRVAKSPVIHCYGHGGQGVV